MKSNILQEVSVCIKDLYDKGCKFPYIPNRPHIDKEIVDGEEYYDLKNDKSLLCMDGECVIVIDESPEWIELLNINGDADVTFKLSKEEYEIAALKAA